MAVLTAAEKGSPPRVRGKPLRRSIFVRGEGITPARAGKTYAEELAIVIREDHPRACGENGFLWPARRRVGGSPPRVRGKRGVDFCHLRRGRITPACAGKTAARRDLLPSSRDHPRVCGENSCEPGILRVRVGSPPRVRGKHAVSQRYRTQFRITPACAGKTPRYFSCIR